MVFEKTMAYENIGDKIFLMDHREGNCKDFPAFSQPFMPSLK
jgi:hypothetical protein